MRAVGVDRTQHAHASLDFISGKRSLRGPHGIGVFHGRHCMRAVPRGDIPL
jgi:hypothetical protein